jgi:hypothetical protein
MMVDTACTVLAVKSWSRLQRPESVRCRGNPAEGGNRSVNRWALPVNNRHPGSTYDKEWTDVLQ